MPFKETKILEFNQYHKFHKVPFIICVDLETLIEKIGECESNPEKSFATKLTELIPLRFFMSTLSPFKDIENKDNVHRGKNWMKSFSEFFREHTTKIN